MPPLRLEFVEITDWLWCLRTPIVACFAIRDRDGIVLVDANIAGQHTAILGALADRLGVSVDAVSLRQVLVTHAHADHYGSARELARYTGAEVLGAAEESDALAGRRALAAPKLSDWERPLFERITSEAVPAPPPVRLDRALRPGDPLDWEIGAEVVAAPGHTPGQLAVWVPSHRTLIAGDALASHDGRPIVGVFNVDPIAAVRTAAKLLDELRPSLLCVAHGAALRGDLRTRFDPERAPRIRAAGFMEIGRRSSTTAPPSPRRQPRDAGGRSS